jgi:hypothetical protein
MENTVVVYGPEEWWQAEGLVKCSNCGFIWDGYAQCNCHGDIWEHSDDDQADEDQDDNDDDYGQEDDQGDDGYDSA